MSNLTRFESNDGIELYIDGLTGEAFASQTGYCRMSGKAKSTISERVERFGFEAIKSSEILTTTGLKTVRLLPADIVFEWLMKDNPELALAMGKAGATVYFHQLAGYSVTSNTKTDPILSPEFQRAQDAVLFAQEQYLFWKEQNNIRMMQKWETFENRLQYNICSTQVSS